MIVNIAGTSGSGKSHAARSFLEHMRKNGTVEPVRKDERIIGYDLTTRRGKKPIYLLGAYDQPSGGCDTFKQVAYVFDTVARKHRLGVHVVYEGLFVMNMTRGPELAAEYGEELTILQLTTPLSSCLASVNQRRAVRGAGPLEDTTNTRDNYVRAERYCSKMRGAGARVLRVSRDEVVGKLLKLVAE